MTAGNLPRKSALDPSIEKALDDRLRPAAAIDSELIAKVKARVMSTLHAEIASDLRTVRGDSGGWEQIGPGVERKRLWSGRIASSWMMRLAPGALVDAHVHRMDEECVVLEGTLRIGNLVLAAGDFHVAPQGTLHELTTTDTGALVYLRGADS